MGRLKASARRTLPHCSLCLVVPTIACLTIGFPGPLLAEQPASASTSLPLHAGWTTAARIATPHATQAAAADERHLYAISNTSVARIDRRTGRLLATASHPTTKHLNSGFVHEGRLYCAHSNYPATPHASDIRVYDPADDGLDVFHVFADPPGSLVWCVKKDGNWWCCFAHYGNDNHQTCLVEYAEGGLERELRRFLFPHQVVADWDGMSASGGIWLGDEILASHHHFRVLYRLRLPRQSQQVLELVEAVACPFPGQGFAVDPAAVGLAATDGCVSLVGIDRPGRAIVCAVPEAVRK
jgi:hypothetical protein